MDSTVRRGKVGVWLGVLLVFLGSAWDAQWHARGVPHDQLYLPHFVAIAGLLVAAAAAAYGRRTADGFDQVAFDVASVAAGIGAVASVVDEINHIRGVHEGVIIGLAHLASSLGTLTVLSAAIVLALSGPARLIREEFASERG